MKKLYRSLIVLALVFVGFVQNANASHISGVDFSYTCVGQDSFLVTFNVYKVDKMYTVRICLVPKFLVE